jgi:hypothetical protein
VAPQEELYKEKYLFKKIYRALLKKIHEIHSFEKLRIYVILMEKKVVLIFVSNSRNVN